LAKIAAASRKRCRFAFKRLSGWLLSGSARLFEFVPPKPSGIKYRFIAEKLSRLAAEQHFQFQQFSPALLRDFGSVRSI